MQTKFVPTYQMPSEYDRQAAEARRRQAMAEALEAQAYQPLSGSDAPTPAAAPLVMALQSFLSARQRNKAMEAAKEAKGLESQYADRMLGRLQGGYVYQPDKELEQQMAKKPEETLTQYNERMQATPFTAKAAAVPEQTELAEVMRQSQYRSSPEEVMGMAFTDIGTEALKNRPMMAQRLAQMLEKKPTEYELEKTPEGIVRIPKGGGEASFVTMNGKVVMPRDEYSLGMSPKEKAQYDLDVARFGVDQAQFNLARTRAADEGIDVSGVSMPKGITPVRQPAATVTGAPAAPAAAAPTAPAPTAVRPAPMPGAPKAEAPPPATGEKRRVPLIENPNLGGKQKRELLILEPQTRARASSTQAEIQSLVDMANDLRNHPGLKEITGKLGQYSVTDLSPLAREARGIYDALRYKTSLLKTAMVREANTTGGAFGNMTEQEWPRLESSFGNISNAQDAAGLETSLSNYINNVNQMGKTNLGIYEDTYGKLDWSPIEYQPLSKKYSDKSKPGPSSRGRGGQWGRATVVSQ